MRCGSIALLRSAFERNLPASPSHISLVSTSLACPCLVFLVLPQTVLIMFAVLQSGAGHLSPAPRQDADLTSALAFAASVHVERHQLRVRVVDLPVGMAPQTAAACLVTELTCGGLWAAACYADGRAQPTRFSPCIAPNAASAYPPLPPGLRLSASDVVLVTGGAKGESGLPACLPL